jgi:hypothetical protein
MHNKYTFHFFKSRTYVNLFRLFIHYFALTDIVDNLLINYKIPFYDQILE